MSTHLIEIVERLPHAVVVLVGDLMLDRYLYGNAERLSPEAPVPVIHFQKEETRLGGAGGVAANLAALGAGVRVVGVVGNDQAGLEVRTKLKECGVSTDALIESPGRPTVCKTRLIGLAQHRHPQQMMRLDYEEHAPLPPGLAGAVIDAIASALDGAKILCIEDYNKGLLTDEVSQKIISLARERGVPVIVDPSAISDYRRYQNATALKLNRLEAEKASKLPVRAPEEFAPAAEGVSGKRGAGSSRDHAG